MDPEPDPPFKQALGEALRESWDVIRSYWWAWLVLLLTIGMLMTIYWFFTNYGIGTIYQRMGEGEFSR